MSYWHVVIDVYEGQYLGYEAAFRIHGNIFQRRWQAIKLANAHRRLNKPGQKTRYFIENWERR